MITIGRVKYGGRWVEQMFPCFCASCGETVLLVLWRVPIFCTRFVPLIPGGLGWTGCRYRDSSETGFTLSFSLPQPIASHRCRPTWRTQHATTCNKRAGSRSNSICLLHLDPSWLPRPSPHHQGLQVPNRYLPPRLPMPPAAPQAVLQIAPWRCSALGLAQKRR